MRTGETMVAISPDHWTRLNKLVFLKRAAGATHKEVNLKKSVSDAIEAYLLESEID